VGQDIRLKASDDFEPSVYRADPSGAPKGAVVVIQEIFGVNHHIRGVCDRLADEGYVAIAPAIFDRIEPGFTSGYSPDEGANAQIRRQSRLARDAARHPGGNRRGEVDRSDRHHRLLSRWQHRLRGGDQALGIVGRDRLLWR
jgi:dienelactone hydrolase